MSRGVEMEFGIISISVNIETSCDFLSMIRQISTTELDDHGYLEIAGVNF